MLSKENTAFSADEFREFLRLTCNHLFEWTSRAEEPGSSVRPPVAAHTRNLDLGAEGCSRDDLVTEVQEALLRSVNPWTGRFWEKLYSRPDPSAVVAELVMACSNASGHVQTANPFFVQVEIFCVKQLGQLFGFDSIKCDGLTMPGGSASNTLALQTCLLSRFPNFRKAGVTGTRLELLRNLPLNRNQKRDPPRLLVFASSHCHYSIDQAVIGCGLGSESLIKIDCDDHGRMDPRLLEEMIHRHIEAGDLPVFLCATAGTTVLGAFDPIQSLSQICARHGMWLHIDGSWGGPAIFAPEMAPLFLGSERAQSITLNPHKLLGIPHQCSFLLFSDRNAPSSLKIEAPYLFHNQPNGCEHSEECNLDQATKTLGCGRRPDAFKFYLAWKRHGSLGFSNRISQTLHMAQSLLQYILDNQNNLALEVGPIADPLFLQICFRPTMPSSISVQEAEDNILLSNKCVLHVHHLLKASQYAVDFAPIPQTQELFVRLVVHPFTQWDDLKEFVSLVGREGIKFYKDVKM